MLRYFADRISREVLSFLISKKPIYLVLALFCIFASSPNKAFAEKNVLEEGIPSISLSLHDELKQFNEQLGLLEKMIGKRIRNQSLDNFRL